MKRKIIYFFTSLLAICSLSSCGENVAPSQSYDGRVFDISASKDGSLTAQSKKDGNYYSLTITGKGVAMDYSKKEEVPWNPIAKKISTVSVTDGIKNIGDYFFQTLTLSEYILPASVNSVGDHSFNESAIIYTYGDVLNNIENDVYYYSETKPTTAGNYFYMENGEPRIWILSPLSFLFIGNSFTYRGNNISDLTHPEVPENFLKIATNLDLQVNIDFVVKGSHSLTKFANPEDEMGSVVETKLTTNQYDYVILQEQSTTPINNYSTFASAVKKLKTRIDQTQDKCKTVLYETWGTPYNVSETPATYGATVGAMEEKLRSAYTDVAAENNCLVNYVGKAFTYAYETEHINLYATDERHQNALGAYLSAACHVRSIFKLKVSNCTEYCGLSQSECKALLGIADKII